MKKIYEKLFLIVGLVISITCFHYQDKIIELTSRFQTEKKDHIVTVKTSQKTYKIELEDYLVGVLAGEMPVSFELEALKAQAVASRTFVLSRNLIVDNTTNSQVYLNDSQMKEKWGKQYKKNKSKIKKAIQETRGEVLTYHGEYISALFFSSSNGKTVNSEDYFTGHLDYLKAVDSSWDQSMDPNYQRTKTFTKKQLASIFHVSSPKIKVIAYTSSGYVDQVSINGRKYSGREIREKLQLASSCFQVKKTSQGYQFTTKGSGHGVGMSQYGAQGMAKNHKTYDEILHHYYQNVKIERI